MSKNAGKARALLEAALGGDVAALERLLENRGNPDLTGSDGRTAIMNAAGSVQVAAVKLLLAAGADVNRVTNGGSSALVYAVKPDYPNLFGAGARRRQEAVLEVVKILLGAGARVTPETLSFAINFRPTEIVEVLLRSGKSDRSTLRRALDHAASNAYEANNAADLIAANRRLVEARL